MCSAAQHAEGTHQGGADRAHTPADIVVNVPDDNYQTSAGPTERLLQSSWGIDWAGGQDLRCDKQLYWGHKRLTSVSPFQDYRILQKLLFKLVLHKFPTTFPQKSNTFPTSFKTMSNQITSPIILLKN